MQAATASSSESPAKRCALRSARSSVTRLPARRPSGEPQRDAVVSQRSGSERVGRAAARLGLDPIGDQQQALAQRPGRHAHHLRVHMGAVADQVGRQTLVGERRAREPGLAVVERSHRIEEMGDVPRAARDRLLDLGRPGAAVAQRREHPLAAELFQQLRRPGHLWRERQHADRAPPAREHLTSLRAVVTPDRGDRLGSRRAGGEPGPLEVDPDRRRARKAAARHLFRERSHAPRQLAPGQATVVARKAVVP